MCARLKNTNVKTDGKLFLLREVKT